MKTYSLQDRSGDSLKQLRLQVHSAPHKRTTANAQSIAQPNKPDPIPAISASNADSLRPISVHQDLAPKCISVASKNGRAHSCLREGTCAFVRYRSSIFSSDR